MSIKRWLSIAILTILAFPMTVFADAYDFSSDGYSIQLDPAKWEIYTKDNYTEYESSLGDLYADFDTLFSNNVYQVIAYANNDSYYWTLGYSEKGDLAFSQEFSDEEILEVFQKDLPIPVSSELGTGEYTKVELYKHGNYRFVVMEGTVESGGQKMGVIQYMAPIENKGYVLTAYSVDSTSFTASQKADLQNDAINGLSFSVESNLYDPDSTESYNSGTSFGNIAKMTLPTIAVVIIIFILKNRVKKTDKKQNNGSPNNSVNSDNAELEDNTSVGPAQLDADHKAATEAEKKKSEITSSQSPEPIPADLLIKLKKLHDEGILTDEEFTEKKRKLLGL